MSEDKIQVVVTARDEASKSLDGIRGKFKSLKSDLGSGLVSGIGIGAGFGIVAAAGAAASAISDFAFDSISAASDLNETLSKSKVIFGDSAGEIEEWGKTAADAMGLSEQAAIDAASGFSGLFQTVGIARQEATDFSMDLTQLGSDLASFFNTDVASALDALKSGLSGESEPLRKFNVFLSETAVNAELAKEGVKRVNGQFTEGQKVTARYKLIMEQTGAAQGDFARTSDGLANSQRTLNADLEDVKASVGQTLLPLMTDLAHGAKDVLGAFKDLDPGMQSGITSLGLLVVAGTPVILMLGKVKDAAILAKGALSGISAPIGGLPVLGGVLLGIAGVNYGLDEAAKKASELRTAIAGVSPETRDAAANQEVFGMRLGDVTDHVADFLGIVAPWSGAFREVSDASDDLNGRMTATEEHMDDMRESAVFAGQAFTNDLAPAMSAGFDAAATQAERDAREVVEATAEAARSAVERNKASLSIWDLMRDKQVADTARYKELYHNSVLDVTGDIVGTLKGAKDRIASAMDDALWAFAHPKALENNIAGIKAQLASKKMADGLKSHNPQIVAATKQWQEKLFALWDELAPGAGSAARDAANGLTHLDDTFPGTIRRARDFVDRINAIFATLRQNYHVNVDVARGVSNKVGRMPTFAEGGYAPEGTTAVVGERGPEIVTFGQNAHVWPTGTGPSGSQPIQIFLDGRKIFDVVDARMGKRMALTSSASYTRG